MLSRNVPVIKMKLESDIQELMRGMYLSQQRSATWLAGKRQRVGSIVIHIRALFAHISYKPAAHSAVTKRNWMPFHLKMRRSPQNRGVRSGRGASARQLRHNLLRTYNQTIAIIINRYTFNDRVCRAQAVRCNFNSVGARDCGVYVIAAFVLSSLTSQWWMYRFGVGISGKTAPGVKGGRVV